MNLQERLKHEGTALLLTLSFSVFIRMLGISIVDLILSLYANTFTNNGFLIGLAIGAFSIFQVIFMIPLGRLSDKIGRKNVICLGISIYLIGTVLCGFATNIYILIIFRFIQGSGAFIGVIQALIGDSFQEENKRNWAMTFYSTAVVLGYMIGLPLGGIIGSFSYQLTFFINSFFILAGLILILIFVKEPESRIREIQEITLKEKLKKVLNLKLIGCTLAGSVLFFTFGGLFGFLGVYAKSKGIDLLTLSLIMIPLILFFMSSFFLSNRLYRKIGLKWTITTGFFISIIFLLLIVFINDNLLMIIFLAAVLFGVGLIWPLLPSIVVGSVSREYRATASSFYNAIRLGFQALGPIIVGLIAGTNLQNLSLSFLTIAIIVISSFFIIFYIFVKVEKNNL
ncbi:MAG: MFS transporter [Candidatus Lokiarchaeota archaeon]|nr:MFS transporter [Candidatus Lokiarchaeota archaeon]